MTSRIVTALALACLIGCSGDKSNPKAEVPTGSAIKLTPAQVQSGAPAPAPAKAEAKLEN